MKAKDNTCPTCKGEGWIFKPGTDDKKYGLLRFDTHHETCPTCHGSGHIPETMSQYDLTDERREELRGVYNRQGHEGFKGSGQQEYKPNCTCPEPTGNYINNSGSAAVHCFVHGVKPTDSEPEGRSNCHNAPAVVRSSDEGTSHYECSACDKPCDLSVDKPKWYGELKKAIEGGGSIHLTAQPDNCDDGWIYDPEFREHRQCHHPSHRPEKQNNKPANSDLEAETGIKPTVQFDPPTIQKTAEIVGKPDRWADSVPEDTDTNVGISSPDQLRDYLIRLVDSAVTQHRLEINLPTQPGRSVMTSLEVAETIESLISQRLLSELQNCLTGEEDPRVALSKRINELRGQ